MDQEKAVPDSRTPSGWHKFWEKEMTAFDKRTRKWKKQGNTIVRRFLDRREGEQNTDYQTPNRDSGAARINLFHTNVSTLLAMLYGSTPRIDVSREHQDPDDDIARVSALLFQRILQADVDDSGEDFPTVLKATLQDRLLPGLGIARVRYECETCKIQAEGENGETVEIEQMLSEDAPVDYVHWQDFAWGWCRTWAEMPWMGFRAYLTKEEAEQRFGKKVAKKLDYKQQLPTGDTENRDHVEDKDQRDNVAKAEVWEIWSKKERKVFWYSAGTDLILDAVDDPLNLQGFWPTPRPMTANLTTTLFVPTADYILAQDIYNQIDELYTRISVITRAIKVVGVYDQNAGQSVGRMLKEGVENDLIPVENWAMFAEKGGLKGQIDWFPVQEVVGVLQTLRQVLGEQIELLYQVTGMSDILRGANTDQYTSDGTNQLKAKFGSIRVQALQDEFARFASELEGLRAEVISKHFSPQTIYQQANADFLPQADKGLVGPALQLMQSPQIKWRIDIRPESIAMVDYAQLKAERTDFLTAMATYLQSAQAVMQAVPGSLPILLEMLKWGMAGFKGSNYLEGTMDRAIDMAKKAPPQQDDGGESQAKLQIEQLKLQAQQMKGQQEIQKIQIKAQTDMRNLQMKVEGEIAKINADAQADQTLEQMDARNELLKIRENLNASLAEIAAQLEANLQVEQAQSAFAIAESEVNHDNTMTEMQKNASLATRPSNAQADTD